MIDISPSAQQHFVRLLKQQEGEELGIRLRVLDAGTPAANCELEFCERTELHGNEWTLDYEGFQLYLDAADASWLDGASIDYQTHATGGMLNIHAPGIKGEAPAKDAGLLERVRYVLEAEINPRIAAHGGYVSLTEIRAEGVVVLQFGGGCHGCGMADVTLKEGIEKTLRQRIPEITAVQDATDHRSGSHPYYHKSAAGPSALD